MIADAAATDRSALAHDVDVCIVGGGPAGITIARRLAAAGAEVALMEAGGLEYSEQSQAVYQGRNVGMDYFPLDVPRLRYFGGSSNHWGGWCRALDAYDFEPKPFNPMSGWPIDRIELDPYRRETDAILDIPSESERPDLPLEQSGYDFRHVQFRFSDPPTRFGEKYGAEIAASDRIRLVLNANLVDLRLDDDLGAVAAAVFRSYAPDDPGFAVRARYFCLCTGGIENPRLMLAFRSQVPEGIGNRNGLVGRYFCEHPHFTVAEAVLAAPNRALQFFAPTHQFIVEHAVLNFGLRLYPGYGPTLPSSLAREASGDLPFALRIAALLQSGPRGEAARPADLPALVTSRVRMAYEQALNPQSRVRLGEERDALGLPRAVLDWQLSELDVHTLRTAVTAFGRHMAEQDLGRVRLLPWLLAEPVAFPDTSEDEVAGKHHMGTTRMADDPRHGVVDRDCRVHGIDNLYIGGSSVFPTGGHANPTYTLVQLALRLGDHLGARLGA